MRFRLFLFGVLAIGLAVMAFFVKSNRAVQATAAATFLLAAATAWMASETRGLSKHAEDEARAVLDQAVATQAQADAVRQQAESAIRQVEVATAALEASIRPWLTASDRHDTIQVSITELANEPDQPIQVELVLMNVGQGIAVIPPDTCQVMGSRTVRQGYTPTKGFAQNAVVAPGRQARIQFEIRRTTSQWTGMTIERFTGQPDIHGEFNAWVMYTDVNGHQAACALIQITRRPYYGDWRISRIDYRRASLDDPWGSKGETIASVEFA